jgi:hypothetical protein
MLTLLLCKDDYSRLYLTNNYVKNILLCGPKSYSRNQVEILHELGIRGKVNGFQSLSIHYRYVNTVE